MKLLLDTHIVFWACVDHPSLPPRARLALQDRDTTVAVSIASAWEMAIK